MDNTYAKGGAQRSAGGAAVAGQKKSHYWPTQPCREPCTVSSGMQSEGGVLQCARACKVAHSVGQEWPESAFQWTPPGYRSLYVS